MTRIGCKVKPGARRDALYTHNHARVVMQFAGTQPSSGLYVPDLLEAAELDESAAAADRGEFATDKQVRALWAKHGL